MESTVGANWLSSGSIDEMDTTVSVNNAAELANLEPESGIFERLLHLSTLEEAEIAARPCRRAVAVEMTSRQQLGSVTGQMDTSGEQVVPTSER